MLRGDFSISHKIPSIISDFEVEGNFVFGEFREFRELSLNSLNSLNSLIKKRYFFLHISIFLHKFDI